LNVEDNAVQVVDIDQFRQLEKFVTIEANTFSGYFIYGFFLFFMIIYATPIGLSIFRWRKKRTLANKIGEII
jgi:hypothetical protein